MGPVPPSLYVVGKAFMPGSEWLLRRSGRRAGGNREFASSLPVYDLGPGHPRVAATFSNLANVYSAQGQYDQPESFQLRGLALLEEALGAEHPEVATSLNDLAALYTSQGRYSEAEPLYRQALVIREKVLGRDHPNVAQSLNNLAELYRDQDQYAQPEPLYRRALSILERSSGPEHPNTATVLNNLAALYNRKNIVYPDVSRIPGLVELDRIYFV